MELPEKTQQMDDQLPFSVALGGGDGYYGDDNDIHEN